MGVLRLFQEPFDEQELNKARPESVGEAVRNLLPIQRVWVDGHATPRVNASRECL